MKPIQSEMAAEYLERGDARVKSFTAASGLPWKLLQNRGCVVDGRIRPVHLQLYPTNKCDYGKCPWCSCRRVDRNVELSLDEIRAIFAYFAKLGTTCVTITGGGEPTAHRHLREIMEDALRHDIEIEMVTNGMQWAKPYVDIQWANIMLTWLRISTVDPHGEPKIARFRSICERLPDVDVGISFTIPSDVNVEYAKALCGIADSLPNLTHLRFVHDILDPDDAAMDITKAACAGITEKAIFQQRSKWSRGMRPCLISKLKPTLDATGLMFPCCGAQYAVSDDIGRMPTRLSMGHWRNFHMARPFDGSVCEKCYYEKYNVALLNMTEEIKHERFV